MDTDEKQGEKNRNAENAQRIPGSGTFVRVIACEAKQSGSPDFVAYNLRLLRFARNDTGWKGLSKEVPFRKICQISAIRGEERAFESPQLRIGGTKKQGRRLLGFSGVHSFVA